MILRRKLYSSDDSEKTQEEKDAAIDNALRKIRAASIVSAPMGAIATAASQLHRLENTDWGKKLREKGRMPDYSDPNFIEAMKVAKYAGPSVLGLSLAAGIGSHVALKRRAKKRREAQDDSTKED